MGRPRKPDAMTAAERSTAWRSANTEHKISVTVAAKVKAVARAAAQGRTLKDYVSDLIEGAP